ncbi:MAG: hypothetical protein HQ517_13705 [SAR324 cluster bacterium]|nr:hypothetical protein [SAR324 cluster bacterium]
MPETIIRFKNMTDDDLESVAETMADMIIGHIQNDKVVEVSDQGKLKSKDRLPDIPNENV